MKYLKLKEYGPVSSDCTGSVYFNVIGNPTVKELCDDILTNINEWGYIGIYNPTTVDGKFFGDPHIEYFRGKYVKSNGVEREKINFNFPNDMANKKVKEVKASGGWSRMDYLFIID